MSEKIIYKPSIGLPKVCGVYSFTHVPTGRKYVGSAVDVYSRKRGHELAVLKGKGCYFHDEVRRLGLDQFEFEIVERCAADVRFEREKFYITSFNSLYPSGFNIVDDPTKGWDYMFNETSLKRMSDRAKGNTHMRGFKFTEEAKAAMSVVQRASHNRPEVRAKMSASHKGKKLPLEQRMKIAAAGIGRKPSEETRAKLSASAVGRVKTLEHRARIALSGMGKKNALRHRLSDDVKRRLSLASMGNTHAAGRKGRIETQETRAKVSAGIKASWLVPETRARRMAGLIGHKGSIGYIPTAETRMKLSEAQKRIANDPAERARRSARMKGNKRSLGYRHTPEARARISAFQKAKWAVVTA